MSKFKHTETDLIAVKYFLQFLQEKGPLTLKKLVGHWNQAPDDVKKIIPSTKHEVFQDFLARNDFYFEMKNEEICARTLDSGNKVPERNEATLQLSRATESECKAINYFINIIKSKGTRTVQQLVSALNHNKDPEIIGTVGSQKLLDIQLFLRKHPSIFKLENDEKVSLCHSPAIAVICPEKPLCDVYNNGMPLHNIPQTTGVPSGEGKVSIENIDTKEVFLDLFGENFVSALENLLVSINIRELHRVEMLWFDINKRPFIKILTANVTVKYVIHELKDLPFVSKDFLQNFLKSQKIQCVSKFAYGIKGRLHTLRANWLGDELIGLTLFHQVHCHSIDDKFKETQGRNLHAILYDPVTTPSNLLYSYMRKKCQNLAEHYHVLLVDYNGKIAGYDAVLPVVLGKCRRISCTDSKYRTDALLEAYAHNPFYVVTNCLDVMDIDVLKTIQLLCRQGIQVVVAVHQDCKDDIMKFQ